MYVALMASEGEWERLVRTAREAIARGRPEEFRIDGEAGEIAKKHGMNVEKLRYSFLADAFKHYLDTLPTAHCRPGERGSEDR